MNTYILYMPLIDLNEYIETHSKESAAMYFANKINGDSEDRINPSDIIHWIYEAE